VKKTYELILVFICVLIALVWTYNRNYFEVSTLLWHLKHGNHADLGPYRFRVPLSYEVDDPHGLPSLSITKFPNHLQLGHAMIWIEWRKHSAVEEPGSHQFDQMLQRMRAQKIADRSVNLSDSRGACVEYKYDRSAEDPRIVALINSEQINCVFEGDFVARFTGSPELKDDFYQMLRTAQRVKGKS
jgi:hypothetical protein